MLISNRGIEFLKLRENCKLTAYLDLGGVPTIGYGSLHMPNGREVKLGDKITQYEADTLLALECDGIGRKLNKLLKIALAQYETDALVSFTYNIGTEAFRTSTLRKLINSTHTELIDYEALKFNFLRWNKAHIDGKLVSVAGLTNRRKLEYKLFSEGIYE